MCVKTNFFVMDSRRAGSKAHLKYRVWHYFGKEERCYNLCWTGWSRKQWCPAPGMPTTFTSLPSTWRM